MLIRYVTRLGKTGPIYTKYTPLDYGTYILLCMCYPVVLLDSSWISALFDVVLDTRQNTYKKLLHLRLSKSGQIVHADKTSLFPDQVTLM